MPIHNFLIDIGSQGKRDYRRVLRVMAETILTPQERRRLYAIGAREAGMIVVADAKRRAPFRTGQLKSAIRLEYRRSKRRGRGRHFGVVATGNALVTVDARRAPYWPYVEFGHRIVRNKKVFGRVRAKPFLRPALRHTRDEQFRKAALAMCYELIRIKRRGGVNTIRIKDVALLGTPTNQRAAPLPAAPQPALPFLLPPPR